MQQALNRASRRVSTRQAKSPRHMVGGEVSAGYWTAVTTIRWTAVEFPGYVTLYLAGDGEGLVRVAFAARVSEPPQDWPVEWKEDKRAPVLVDAVRQLREYFAREREQFSVKLKPAGTPFQLEVWKAVSAIQYGRTRSYREIAEEIG